MARRVPCVPIVVVFVVAGSDLGLVSAAAQAPDAWWSPETAACFLQLPRYENPFGRLSILNTAGRIETKGQRIL